MKHCRSTNSISSCIQRRMLYHVWNFQFRAKCDWLNKDLFSTCINPCFSVDIKVGVSLYLGDDITAVLINVLHLSIGFDMTYNKRFVNDIRNDRLKCGTTFAWKSNSSLISRKWENTLCFFYAADFKQDFLILGF